MSDIDAVIFDFGNVLIGWDPRLAFRDVPDVDRLFDDLDFHRLNHERDAGGTWADARDATAPNLTRYIDQYLAHFDETLTGPVPGTAEIVADLRRAGLRLYGLTNWSAELYPHAPAAAPAIKILDDVLVSGRVGIAKPDAAIFQIAIERFAVDPRRTLFIDDSPANIAAAQVHGLLTHTFVDAPTLRAALVGLDIPLDEEPADPPH